MSDIPPRDDSQLTLVDPTSPGGSRIYVFATLPHSAQNDAPAPAAAPPATALTQDGDRSLTPSVIYDTYDRGTPSPPPLTQLPRARALATSDAGTGRLRLEQPSAVDGPMNRGGQGAPGAPQLVQPQPVAAAPSPDSISSWGSGLSWNEEPSSSPLSFDLSDLTRNSATPTPMGPHASQGAAVLARLFGAQEAEEPCANQAGLGRASDEPRRPPGLPAPSIKNCVAAAASHGAQRPAAMPATAASNSSTTDVAGARPRPATTQLQPRAVITQRNNGDVASTRASMQGLPVPSFGPHPPHGLIDFAPIPATLNPAGDLNNADIPNNEDSTDYFSFFSTPPCHDPPHYRDSIVPGQLSADGAPLASIPEHGGDAPLTDAQLAEVYNGEQTSDSTLRDEFRTSRKRTWNGTPDPEDVQRGLQRLRTSSSRNSSRNGGRRIPGMSTSRDVFDPWADSQSRSRNVWASQPPIVFSPVQASTPAPPAVSASRAPSARAGLLMSSRSTPHPNTRAAQPSAPRSLTHSTPTVATQRSRVTFQEDSSSRTVGPLGTGATRESAHPPLVCQDNDAAAEQPLMDVDGDTQEHGCTSPASEEPKKDKGKRRATHVDNASVPNAPRLSSQVPGDDWSHTDMAEARQQSLRQTLADRARYGLHGEGHHAQSLGAGPSNARDTTEAARRSENAEARLTRDGRNARERETDDSNHPDADDPPPQLLSGARRQRSTATGQHQTAQVYYPVPNTRAAQYVDAHPSRGPSNTPSWIPQRSPLSRVANLQRTSRSPEGRLPSADLAARRREWQRETLHDSAWSPLHIGHEDSRDEDDDRGDDYEDRRNDPAPVNAAPRNWMHEEGEILPTALQEGTRNGRDEPTDIPPEGFPIVHRDDPESSIRGMANDWVREIWRDQPGTSFYVDVFNYRYVEDDAHNRRVEEALRTAIESISGESDFDVVPPEPEEGSRLRARDLPTTWAVRGLTQYGVTRCLARTTWSFAAISFTVMPRSATIPTWLFMLEGFLTDNARNIRAALMRTLDEQEMRDWMGRMVAANPEFAGWDVDDAVTQVLRSLRIETLQLSNGNYVTNVYMRSPTRDPREWRRWVAALRSRRYRSYANGTGRVRYTAPCAGCGGVSHPAHLCPFPRVPGWNGPEPGEGVFGERRRENRPTQAQRNGRNGGPPPSQRSRTQRRDENEAPGSSHEERRRAPRSPRGGDRNSRTKKGSGNGGSANGGRQRR